MKIFICNRLHPYFVIYSKEINKILNNNQFVTNEWSNADYIITCISQELNYPIFGNMDYSRPKIEIKNIYAFIHLMCKQFRINPNNKLVIFQNSPTVFSNRVISVCYAKNDNDNINVVICPPAIQKYSFNNTVNKKYTLSFKGDIHRSPERNRIFNAFAKYNNSKVVIIEKTNNNYEYGDLLLNSVFSLVIEGDLVWSYRLTETINAGSIPIIIKPKNKNIFAFDELIDYSLFSIVINEDEIDKLMTTVLPSITLNDISKLMLNLYDVNNQYFISRKTQMNGLIKILKNRLN
jgi:hypothetical protein